MIDLKHEMERELSRIDPPDLWDRIQADAVDIGDADVLDLSTARHRQRPSLWLAVAAATVLLVLVGALVLLDDDQAVDTTPINEVPTPTTSVPLRSGALRTGGVVHRMLAEGDVHSWDDPSDSAEPWADLTRVSHHPSNAGHWNFDLAASTAYEAQAGEVVAYGLVFDVDADGVADYEVGVDNGAPRQGNLRAWVTDLATGEKVERVEAPYGAPVEFSHPAESGGLPVLTFLNGTAPRRLDLDTLRYYAWTTLTRDGVLVARDYAPDTGWITGDADSAP